MRPILYPTRGAASPQRCLQRAAALPASSTDLTEVCSKAGHPPALENRDLLTHGVKPSWSGQTDLKERHTNNWPEKGAHCPKKVKHWLPLGLFVQKSGWDREMICRSVLFLSVVLRLQPGRWRALGKYSTTELHFQPPTLFLLLCGLPRCQKCCAVRREERILLLLLKESECFFHKTFSYIYVFGQYKYMLTKHDVTYLLIPAVRKQRQAGL